MTKKMSAFKVWRHLAARYRKATRRADGRYLLTSDKFDEDEFMCIALYQMYRRGFITASVKNACIAAIQDRVGSDGPMGGVNYPEGARLREAFCREMMKK